MQASNVLRLSARHNAQAGIKEKPAAKAEVMINNADIEAALEETSGRSI
jgi:hypothetical protein